MNYPDISPEIFTIGPIALRWYGVSYLAAFAVAWWLGARYAKRFVGWDAQALSDVIFYGALGAVVGGRVGYVFFYGWQQFVDNPLWLFMVWTGGMSFHGGLIGVVLALLWFARARGMRWFQVTDFIAPLVPPGLGFGRLANFINTELPGRVTEVPWGLHYPCGALDPRISHCTTLSGFEPVLRHASPLYQAALEGLVLGLLMWWFVRKPRPLGSVSGVFLLGYGVLRMISEFFRTPDVDLGFAALGFITRGQLLCIPMVLLGVGLIWWANRYEQPPATRLNTAA